MAGALAGLSSIPGAVYAMAHRYERAYWLGLQRAAGVVEALGGAEKGPQSSVCGSTGDGTCCTVGDGEAEGGVGANPAQGHLIGAYRMSCS